MTTKRIAIIGGAVVALAAGSAGAIAATNDDEAKQREQSVLNTAAKKLDVSPSELRDALEAGQEAQLDQAVKDGKLTDAQRDQIAKDLDDRIDHLGERPFGRGPGHGPPPAGEPPARQEGETNQDGSYVPPSGGVTRTD